MPKHIKEFVEPSFIHESLLCGYLWAEPSLYQQYRNHKITNTTFTEPVWYFYFALGQQMFEKGIRRFDAKTVFSFVTSQPKENGRKSYTDAYNSFGAFKTIDELMEVCMEDNENEQYHFNEVQKYESLRYIQDASLINVNDKEMINKLSKMTLKQVELFVQTKYKEAFSHINSGDVAEYDLSEGLSEVIEEMNRGDAMGMMLHDSPRLSRKIKGWKNGALYYLVLASGVGKSSIAMEKFILALFENGEKSLLAINEESNKKWQQLLLATIASKILKKPLERERLFDGNFDDKTLAILNEAKEWAQENGTGLVKTIELKRYRVEDIFSRVELYRPQGYSKLIIDTFKPDRSAGETARWEAFSNSAQDLHDLIKEDNYNVGTLATVQLKIGKEHRYLDLDSTGKSMEINEVASVVMMGRLLYDDEYEGEKFELKPYDYVIDPFTEKWYTKPYKLNPDKVYMIMFLPKNRFGSEDEQILYEVDYGINSFKEIALVKSPKYGD